MRKKILWIAGLVVVGLVVTVGIVRYSEIKNCRTDPNWEIANEIYKVEKALKEVDEDYACESISKVTPYTYSDSEGNIIIYYCCQTDYLENESGDYTGLDMNAIGLVVDLEMIGNKRECKVNEYDAILCEMDDRTYLCWTLAPKTSCVIEYNAEKTAQENIFRMAESVSVQKD